MKGRGSESFSPLVIFPAHYKRLLWRHQRGGHLKADLFFLSGHVSLGFEGEGGEVQQLWSRFAADPKMCEASQESFSECSPPPTTFVSFSSVAL